MDHIRRDLGNLKKGSMVIVQLKNQANVLLMKASEYRSYRRGGRARYIGGFAKTSPVRLPVPNDGHWFLALDLGGYPGRIDAKVSIVPPPRGHLPEIRNRSPLNEIRQNLTPVEPPAGILDGRTWDVFISHASEDKEFVALPLAMALKEHGVSAWLDKAELRIGDSLRRRIDHGIRSCRFATVIFSPAFFAKGWTQYELDGIVARIVANKQSILPIWHNVTADDVIDYSPSLGDKLARTTDDASIEEIAAEIAEVIGRHK